MLIALDVGNSSISIGVFDYTSESENVNFDIQYFSSSLIMSSKISASLITTSDEYSILFLSILNLNNIKITEIDGVIISSVVPQLTGVVREAIKKIINFDSLIYVVAPGLKNGLNIKIDLQSQLGTDIVANAVAATSIYSSEKCPLIIIDSGTATTVTAIDKNQCLNGTIIAPGIRISLDALVNNTATLSYVTIGDSISNASSVIGKNTQESMMSGIIFGNSLMIDGFISKIRSESGMENAKVLATGGLAKIFLQYCNEEIDIYPNLTLFGLMKIYELNKRKNKHYQNKKK